MPTAVPLCNAYFRLAQIKNPRPADEPIQTLLTGDEGPFVDFPDDPEERRVHEEAYTFDEVWPELPEDFKKYLETQHSAQTLGSFVGEDWWNAYEEFLDAHEKGFLGEFPQYGYGPSAPFIEYEPEPEEPMAVYKPEEHSPFMQQLVGAEQREAVIENHLTKSDVPFTVQEFPATDPYTHNNVTAKNYIMQNGNNPTEIIFGAHHDAIPGAGGANDNGSGVAQVIDIVQNLQGTANNVTGVLFHGEEHLARGADFKDMGSYNYGKQLVADKVKPKLFIILDCTGNGDTMCISPRESDPEMVKQITKFFDERGVKHDVAYTAYSDTYPLRTVGVPSVLITVLPSEYIENPSRVWRKFHGKEDDLTSINPETMRWVTAVMTDLVEYFNKDEAAQPVQARIRLSQYGPPTPEEPHRYRRLRTPHEPVQMPEPYDSPGITPDRQRELFPSDVSGYVSDPGPGSLEDANAWAPINVDQNDAEELRPKEETKNPKHRHYPPFEVGEEQEPMPKEIKRKRTDTVYDLQQDWGNENTDNASGETWPHAAMFRLSDAGDSEEVGDLVRRFKQGDHDAGDQLFKMYEKMIRQVIQERVVRFNKELFTQDDIDEMFADASVNFVNSVQRYDGRVKLDTYLWKAVDMGVMNNIRSIMREQKHRGPQYTETPEEGEFLPVLPQERALDQAFNQFMDRLHHEFDYKEMLKDLPERLVPGDMWLIQHVNGKTYNEIAKEYGVDKSWVSLILTQVVEWLQRQAKTRAYT